MWSDVTSKPAIFLSSKTYKAKVDIYPSKTKFFDNEFALRFLFKAKNQSETEYY